MEAPLIGSEIEMDPSTQLPITETASSSITIEILPKPALLLKSHCENALLQSRIGIPLLPRPDFNDHLFFTSFDERVKIAASTAQNVILMQYFALYCYMKVWKVRPIYSKREHKIAMFLGEYFYTEPGALNFLQSVSANDIDRISAANLRIITAERPLIPSPEDLGSP